MASDSVLIIGAGLGGLVLAQALQQKRIPFRIFERDRQDVERTQGWAISLHPWLMNDMRSAIRDDESGLKALAPTATLGLPSEGVIYSITDGVRKQLFRFGEGTDQPFVRVDRAKLRQWLLENINVEWGKKFQKYEEDPHGVTAFFEDGTSARGGILVGADGISSRVRRQLLPSGGEPQRLPIGIAVGEVETGREQYEKWLKLANSFSVAFADDRRLFIGLKSIGEDKKAARFYWMFGWADEKAVSPEFWTSNASQKELHDFVMDHLDGLDPEYAEPFRATQVEGILHPPLQMRDMVPPTLPRGRITLLGDAVHPMVPFRGEGGNMAMKDAIVLAATLADTKQQKEVIDMLKDYEKAMSERAGKSVIRSRESTFMHQGIFNR